MQAEQNTSDRRARRPVSDEDIPILDLGPFLAGESGAAEKTAAELRSALEEPPIACVDYLRWFMEQNFALGERSYDRPESA